MCLSLKNQIEFIFKNSNSTTLWAQKSFSLSSILIRCGTEISKSQKLFHLYLKKLYKIAKIPMNRPKINHQMTVKC